MTDRSPLRQAGRIRAGWLFLLLMMAGATVAGAWLWQDYRRFCDAPLNLASAQPFEFQRGQSMRGLVAHLREQGISSARPWYWTVLARELGVASRLQAGEYMLEPGLSPRALLQMLASGKVVLHRFTIVDGWTFRDLRLALARETGLRQTLPGLDNAAIAAQLGIAQENPEGWFMPETYAWSKGDSDMMILERAHRAMRETLDVLWPDRDAASPLASPYEALILASIIEKETGIASERAEIAGVFSRRLQLNMRLQTDPTVVYGLGERYDGNIRRSDLEADTPYNTYTRDGLPPTPIALAGRAAIEAALHPAGGNALYFVAIGDGSGRHAFSNTLSEHNRAVARFLSRSRNR